ncbi:MAG TPA: DUF4296 domain-containing protein [Flavobacterium sp.]|nr:DUF4296 domain-containing protein [Flavobacterium sp.]
MKKAVIFLGIIMLFFSCKDEAVKEPDSLIDKETMQNIIYDLALLDAIKYNEPTTTENYKVNPKEFIYRKYKVDSLQFAQNNAYYASNFEEYKSIYDEVVKRMEGKKTVLDSLVKIEVKRDSLVEAKKKQVEAKKKAVRVKDSLQKIKKKDSLLLLKTKGKTKTTTAPIQKKKAVFIKNGVKVN